MHTAEPVSIALAATFTAQPVEASLSFWLRQFEVPATLALAPYDQIFQQLLDGSSLFGANRRGLNVVLLRCEDWLRRRRGAECERNARDLAAALRQAGTASAATYLLCCCPASPGCTGADLEALLHGEELLAAELRGQANVHVVTSTALGAMYPVADYFDPAADRAGHVPYTSPCFATIGTAIARTLHALKGRPYKVLVADCDNTLWRGVAAEDGPAALEIGPHRRALQELLIARQRGGVLLCLCSKNAEHDVLRVFAERSDMPLRLDHLAAWKINWERKSDNLRQLAAELSLGLDSFVFLDDNPIECAEVRAACPETLVLQLPSQEEAILPLLRNCWALDRLATTAEDLHRTAHYRQNADRESWRRQAVGFAEFIAGLALQVTIAPLTGDEVPRAAQMTRRINQFNAGSSHRTEGEILELRGSPDWHCLGVRVADRFGDHGLVGLMLARSAPPAALEVDTFLMSCRVLGRGSEHRMLAHLGKLAADQGLAEVRIPFVATARNRPLHDFLCSVAPAAGTFSPSAASLFVVSTAAAAATVFAPLQRPPVGAEALERPESSENPELPQGTADAPRPPPPPAGPAWGLIEGDASRRADLLARIAAELQDAAAIDAAITAALPPRETARLAASDAPRTAVESGLAELWQDVLHRDGVGRGDSFLRIGGDSLLGTALLSRIRRVFGVELTMDLFFDSPTLAGMAATIERASRLEAGSQRR